MEKTDGKLLLVDGHNLLFQMFYGMPARIVNKDGRAIQGTLGFVGALLKIIRRVQPSHIAVIFDGEHENHRRELAEDYKGNRPDYGQMPEEENPFSQLPDVYRALDFMGIPHWETEEYETDDEIAAYVYACGKEQQIVISSFDSDFFQLITERVSVLRYRGEKTVLCDVGYIREKLGIEPWQYADYKALTGDAADNIAGIRGVGPKTAAGLMRQFGSLEELLTRRDEVEKPSLHNALIEGEEQLRRNWRLIRLDSRASLSRPPAELAWQDRGLTTTEVLKGIGLK